MLGNSITHYCEWHELLGNPKVLNRGISGDVAQASTTVWALSCRAIRPRFFS